VAQWAFAKTYRYFFEPKTLFGMQNGTPFHPLCATHCEDFSSYATDKGLMTKYLDAQAVVPVSRTRILLWSWRALANLSKVREVLMFLVKDPLFFEMLQKDPKFGYKILANNYLARDFSIPEAITCYLLHYRRLRSLLPDRLLRQVLLDEVTLYALRDGGGRFVLTLGMSRPYDNEGELTLRLRVDGDVVYELSFTIVPGYLVETNLTEALLITRLQGVRGCFAQISAATKALHSVAPDRLLFTALLGVAEAFAVRAIAAIPGHRQTSYSKEDAISFQHAYDDFFSELGFSRSATGLFYATLPLNQKPLLSIQRSHRLRAKKRRAFKNQVTAACSRFFQSFAGESKPSN
jgi:uncharacterized protein VirK/YbjX